MQTHSSVSISIYKSALTSNDSFLNQIYAYLYMWAPLMIIGKSTEYLVTSLNIQGFLCCDFYWDI